MDQDSRSDHSLEELWRVRLAAAKGRYDVAVAEFRRAAAEYRAKDAPFADGGFALSRAIAEETRSRQEYTRILHEFTKLVFDGKPPND